MNDPGAVGPSIRRAGFALRCDPAGVVLEVLVRDQETSGSVGPGRSLQDFVDADSREKMESFLAEARLARPVAGWEMNVHYAAELRSMVFAAVTDGSGLIVAAAASAARLAGLLDQLASTRDSPQARGVGMLEQAARMARARAEEDGGLFDELSRLNNEFANLQRELAKSHQALEQQSQWLWNILASLEVAVVATGPDGTVSFINRAAAVLTGCELLPAAPVALKDLLRLADGPRPGGALFSLDAAWKEGSTILVEGYLLREPPKDPVPVSGLASPLLDQDGMRIGALVLLRDTTSALRLQQLLVETERLGVAAEMAAGMAHTLNNVLFVISGNAEALVPHVPPERVRQLENIRAGVKRAAELTTRLMAFTEPADRSASPVDLNEVVRSAVARQGALPPEVRVRLDLSGAPITVRGAAEKLVDTVAIVLDNAREAIRGPGLIRIATGRESTGGAVPGDLAVLRITDDGEGMSPEMQRRLFTPFASSKFLGRGLGLATARATLAAHGGHMEIRSAPGQGTTVTMTLPCDQDRDT